MTPTTDYGAPTQRQITDHFDGHGLADSILVQSDNPDPNAGGAPHEYTAKMDGLQVASIQFQHGPRNVAGSTPGILDTVLVAIVMDRLRHFQAGPFPSRQNALALTKLEEALHWMHDRAHERARRGVLGQNLK